MNKEQQELLNEVYENYENEVRNLGAWAIDDAKDYDEIYDEESGDTWEIITPFSQEEFIEKCKINPIFSERWGLKIEERELSLEERSFIASSNHNEVSQNIKMFTGVDEDHTLHKHLDNINIPTKLITVTYNNKTIESYES